MSLSPRDPGRATVRVGASRARARYRRRRVGLGFAVGLLAAVVLLSLALGSRSIPLTEVVRALIAPVEGFTDHTVVRDLRIPRTVIGLLVGSALGVSAALMQGVTRNPLADPGLFGISAGASLAVVVAITWLDVRSPAGYVWFALAGAILAALLVHAVAGRGASGSSPVTLALAGAATTAVLTSVSTVILLAHIDSLNQYRFWAVGSLVGRDLRTVQALWPFLALGGLLAAGAARTIDVLALGEDVATGLGQRVHRMRALAMAAVVLLAGAATALAGPLVLIGLVVAHIARRFTGPDHRWLFAYSAVLGPILLLAADVVGRLVLRPAELEAGIVAAFLGAPVLVALVRRARLPHV